MKFARSLCLCASFVLALGRPDRLAAAPPWLKIETPDVRIYSDGSKGDVLDFAVHYTAFRQAFKLLIAPPGRMPPPATVMLFRKLDTLQGYLSQVGRKGDNLVEFTISVGSKEMFALALSGDLEQALTTAFEGDTTGMLRQVGYFLPLWMSQGTGEVLSSLQLGRGNYEIGEDEDRFTQPMEREQPIPWDKFFELSRESEEYRGRKDHFTGIYQAQAWGIMNAVLLGGGSPRDRFAKLASEVHGRDSDRAAVAALAGVGADRLDRMVWRGRAAHNLKFPFDRAAVRAGLKVVPAPDFEVKVQLADLLAGARDPVAADRMLDEAVALAPNAAAVKEALGRRALRNRDRYAAALVFREAIAAGSVDAQAYQFSAEQRIDDARSNGRDVAGGGGDDALRALAEIHRSLALLPGEMGSYLLLVRALYVAPTVTDAALAELTPALADQDQGAAVRLYRSQIYERLGKVDEEIDDLRLVLADPHAPDPVKESAEAALRRVVFEGDRKQVEALVAAGKFADANAVIARANLRVDGSTDTEQYAGLKGWIDDNQVRARALDLYRQGHWQELSDLADTYLMEHHEGGFAKSAHELKRAAQQNLKPTRTFSPAIADGAPMSSGPAEPTVTFLVGNRRWNAFGPYLFALGDQIRAAWDKKATDRLRPAVGTKIMVTFEETNRGTVSVIIRFKAPPGIDKAVVQGCIEAIKNGVPYTPWDDEMNEAMGEKQILMAVFTFH